MSMLAKKRFKDWLVSMGLVKVGLTCEQVNLYFKIYSKIQ